VETVLVTGSSGGIGTVLVPYLCQRGFKVIGLDKDAPSIDQENSNFHFIEGSIHEPEFYLDPYVSGIDHVIHLAATSSLPECESDPIEAFRNNFLGTVKIARYFTSHKLLNFVNASTSAIYEGITSVPFNEALVCNPHLVYPQTKLMSENFLSSLSVTRKFPATSLRFFNVIGPYQSYTRKSPPLLNYLVREYLSKRSPILHSNGYQERDYISVYDICSAITAVLSFRNERHQVFNICSGSTYSVREIDTLVRQALKTNLEPKYREPEKLWNDYASLFEGTYPILPSIIANETNKKSVGSSEAFQAKTGWAIEYPIEKVIYKICESAVKHLTGQQE
jgi:nucleoside-diphosphate-sugar epimerase